MPDEPREKGAMGTEKRRPDDTSHWMPRSVRVGIIVAFAAFLLWHVAYDATHPDYEGLSTSLMFGGIVGAALSINEVLGRRDR